MTGCCGPVCLSDLYRVVRGGLRASVESYSIKELERFYGFTRNVPLGDANSALYAVCAPLELGFPEAIKDEHKTAVEGYNQDDCASTFQLRYWLEDIRQELVDGGAAIERPVPGEGQASDQLTEWQQMIQSLGERIAGDVPIQPEERTPEQQARWVLANILDWHRREEKAVWWEFFRLSDCSVEELIDERGALSQLEYIGEAGGAARRPIHRYRFPVQETSLRGGEELRMPGGDRLGKLVSLDPQAGTVDIEKPAALADTHPEAVFAHDLVPTDAHKQALVRLGEHVADSGIAAEGPYGAARALLLREAPRLKGEPIRRPGETGLGRRTADCRPGKVRRSAYSGPPRGR